LIQVLDEGGATSELETYLLAQPFSSLTLPDAQA